MGEQQFNFKYYPCECSINQSISNFLATPFSMNFTVKIMIFIVPWVEKIMDKRIPNKVKQNFHTPKPTLCTKSGRLLEGIRSSPVICSSAMALQNRA